MSSDSDSSVDAFYSAVPTKFVRKTKKAPVDSSDSDSSAATPPPSSVKSKSKPKKPAYSDRDSDSDSDRDSDISLESLSDNEVVALSPPPPLPTAVSSRAARSSKRKPASPANPVSTRAAKKQSTAKPPKPASPAAFDIDSDDDADATDHLNKSFENPVLRLARIAKEKLAEAQVRRQASKREARAKRALKRSASDYCYSFTLLLFGHRFCCSLRVALASERAVDMASFSERPL